MLASSTKKTFKGLEIDPFVILSILFYLKNINFCLSSSDLMYKFLLK